MYFDRWDIVAAHYAFCVDFHGGQWSDLYRRLCRIGRYYKPSPLDRGRKSLSDNGRAIYDRLARAERARMKREKERNAR